MKDTPLRKGRREGASSTELQAPTSERQVYQQSFCCHEGLDRE